MTDIKCYQCGKHPASIDGLCEPCFLDQQPPLQFKDIKIRRCRECGSLFFESWQDTTIEQIIRSYIQLSDIDCHMKEENWGVSVTVKARQFFHTAQTQPATRETQFRVYIKDSLCDHCAKMLSGYFQAILQVRRENQILGEDERDPITSLVTQSLREDEFISRIIDRKEGTDYYFSSIKGAKRTAEILKKQLGGRIKESYHTVGCDEQKGTDIVRGTILFSLYQYRKGDIVLYRDEVFEILDASQRLKLKNAMKEKVLPWKKVEYEENKNTLSILTPSQYTLLSCQVIDVSPTSIVIMNPDYDTVYLEIPKGIKVKTGKKYPILFFQEHAYWM
jgi:nonsense-mediated mRNA decay protein 3